MPPQDPSMQTAPDPRAELERLRKIKRLRELEAKASGQPVAPAGPSLRSETDAIIEEAAANIPGGYEAFNRKPADPQRMAAMGYVPDPLAKSGYAKPRAPEAPTVNTAPSSNYLTDVVRGLEAPIVGLTGGGLEGWAKTTAQDPVLGATQAVEFISPVDDAARAYQGLKQAGAGLIDGDMQKAAEGAQQFAIDGSFTAMQALPGSMTLRGVTGVATPGRNTLALNMADLERSAVQATRAPPVRKAPPAPVAPVTAPKPFSAPAEPAGGGLVRRNADRIIGGAVGATIGGAGDAYAAPGDGNGEGNGGPLNAGTGAFLGAFGPRMVASSASRGFRAMARPIRPKGFDERVAARAVRNALKAGGITNADEASAAFTARFGDKPAAIADLTQEGVSTAAGLSRRAGATGEAARARGEELLQNRAGRLERDIGQANPNLNPATITGDVERMVALAQEQATPAYAALRQGYPLGSLTSPRLEQLSQIDSMAPHIKAVNDYRATTAATEGRVVGDFEYWDLVKRDIDAKEQQLIAAGATMDDIRLRKLEDTRNALVQELDTLVPDYPAARQLGGEAPKMRESMRQGQRILGQYQTAEEVARLVAGITGQAQLTALQAGVIRSMVQKTEGATGAMASLMSAGSRRKLSEVFGPEAAEALQARFAADAAIVQNAQRINPNIGSVTSQAQMGEGGFLPMAAEAIRAFRSPIEATLAAMSKGGAYSKAQRDLMGQMLLEGATPENLARIFGNRGGRGGRPAPPPPPTGGGAGPARGPTVPPAPTGPAPRARPAPSEEAVMSAMAQVTQPAKGRPMVGPPTRDTIWDGPIPTKPQSLRGWIRSQGGINDRNYMTGDMKAVMGRANGMPGLINRESGTGLDELARKAYQEGFDVDPEDAGTLMRLLEEEFAGSPSYRIGAKEEWEAYQDTLRARRGDLPGQTSSSPPMVGGAALGALTSGGATYAATGDEDLALKAGILGGIGGGVVGSRLAKGSTPKPPAATPRPGPPGVKPPPVKNGFGSRDLPMDEASRMSRAREMGFDVDTPLYHGTSKDFDSFDSARYGQRDGGGWLGNGVYFSPDKSVAEAYGSVVVPAYVKGRLWEFPADVNPIKFVEQKGGAEAFTDWVKSQGFDGVRSNRILKQTVIFDPANIRSINAKFDPSESSSSKLLAGMSGNSRGIADNLKQDAGIAALGSVGGSFANQDDPQAGALGGMGIALGAKYGPRLVNAARRASGTGAPKVKPPPAGKFRGPSQQTFAGVNAKTADRAALGRAQKMEAEGASRDDIWDATGWFKGVDGKWRFEIDDSGAKIGPKTAQELTSGGDHGGSQRMMAGALHHKELYDAYPQLRNSEADIRINEKFSKPNGAWVADNEGVRGGRNLARVETNSLEDARSILLHEAAGHGVQDIEGFARGGAMTDDLLPSDMAAHNHMRLVNRSKDIMAMPHVIAAQKRLDELKAKWQGSDRIPPDVVEELKAIQNMPEKRELARIKAEATGQLRKAEEWGVNNLFTRDQLFDGYKRLAGEAEARNVQTRDAMRMRGEKPGRPWETQDVPDDQQIVRFGSSKAESRPKPPPKGPGTVSRMVAGGAVGGLAGSLGGDANAQEDLSGKITETEQTIADLKKAMADLDKITDPFEKQRFLKAQGYYAGKIDGDIAGKTTEGMERWKAKKEAELEKAEAERKDLVRRDALQSNRPDPLMMALREYGPAVLGIGALFGMKYMRGGAAKASIKTAEAASNKLNKLITKGPVTGAMNKRDENRFANLNKLWQKGGASKDELPFKQDGAGKYKPNAKAKLPEELFADSGVWQTVTKYVKGKDVAIILGGGLDVAIAQPFIDKANENLTKAEAAWNDTPSDETAKALEDAKNEVAAYTLLQRIGMGVAAGRILGTFGGAYAKPMPNIPAAASEQAKLKQFIASQKSPPKPRATRGPPQTRPKPPSPPAPPPPPPPAAISQLQLPLNGGGKKKP